METTWFILLGAMLAAYVILDGFDLGAGMLHLFVARTGPEREQVLRSIGPVWDGNEVWLIAAAGTMFFAFPGLLGTAFSGFYLPLMLVLWLLVFRALALELRHRFESPVWFQAWDVAFAGASLLLAVCFGAALGNVVRGVPLGPDGTFFSPLWTDFGLGPPTGILDWFTLLVALTAVAALAHHGALWLAARTEGPVADRSRRAAGRLAPVALVLAVATTVCTFRVQPVVGDAVADRPWGAVFPALAAAGLMASIGFRRRGSDGRAFLGSALFLGGLLACAATGIYPHVLPGRDPAFGLTVHEAAAARDGLVTALGWWIPGVMLVVGYFVFLYTRLPARVAADGEGGHF